MHWIARLFHARMLHGCMVYVLIAWGGTVTAQDGSLLRRGAGLTNVGDIDGYRVMRPASQLASPDASSQQAATPQQGLTPQPLPYSMSPQQGVSLASASWIYEPPPPVRVHRKFDIVTIRVDEISRVQADGISESRRNTLYDALLKDWLRFEGFGVKPALQNDGDPRVQGSVNQLYRTNAIMQSRESLSFNIAARIVDIRPNGDLVLEASKMIQVNDNIFETSLTGVCRPTDIAADNVVLSRDLLDLQIRKEERGRLRDGYKRGWFTQWFETLLPF